MTQGRPRQRYLDDYGSEQSVRDAMWRGIRRGVRKRDCLDMVGKMKEALDVKPLIIIGIALE